MTIDNISLSGCNEQFDCSNSYQQALALVSNGYAEFTLDSIGITQTSEEIVKIAKDLDSNSFRVSSYQQDLFYENCIKAFQYSEHNGAIVANQLNNIVDTIENLSPKYKVVSMIFQANVKYGSPWHSDYNSNHSPGTLLVIMPLVGSGTEICNMSGVDNNLDKCDDNFVYKLNPHNGVIFNIANKESPIHRKPDDLSRAVFSIRLELI